MAAVSQTVASRLLGDGSRPARTVIPHLREDQLLDLPRHGTPADVADVLLSVPEADRRAMAGTVRTAAALASPELAAGPEAALLIAGAACLPGTDAVVSWLRSRRFHHVPSQEVLDDLVRVLSAPGRPRLAATAAVLADRMRLRPAWPGEWPVAAAILVATGGPPPTTDAVLRAWVRGQSGDPSTLADRLTADPWLDHLLPHLFHTAGLDRAWPPALLKLTTTGRLDRNHLIRLTLHRLRAGGTPAALRPATTTHDLLSPTAEEIARHRKDYVALLDSPQADFARRVLQSLDAPAAAPAPAPASTPAPAPAPTKATAPAPVMERPVVPRFPAAPVRASADAMPPPFESVAALVADLAARVTQPVEPISLERILAGLVTFAQSDRDELISALTPLADTATAPFDILLRTLVRPGRSPDPHPADPLSAMVAARLRELAQQLAGSPPPALLATPASTDGVVSPVRVLFRLIAAERDGWHPGPYDLAQALLRLPATVDPAVAATADRLVSSAGRQFAAWIRAGGLPQITAAIVPGSQRRVTFTAPQAPTLPQDAHPEPTPDGVPPALHDPTPSATVDSIIRDLLTPPPPELDARSRPEMRCWPLVLPHHRELVAAHCIPLFSTEATTADVRQSAETLRGLAGASGSFGPAMALALSHGLVAREELLRTSTVDAVLRMAGSTGLHAGLIGRELRALLTSSDGLVQPAARSLRQIGEGQGWHITWAIAYAVVPALLRQHPAPPGTPALLTVAADAASATGAHADLPEVTAAATGPGPSDVAAAAARLAQIIR